MAGSTATISISAFRADWLSHATIAEICTRHTITKDQVIRLRDVWKLPLRNDRRLRAKPKRQRDPTEEEIRQACLRLQSQWDDRTREMRAVTKATRASVKVIYLDGVEEPPPEEEP
jgi:hypothetical protein